MLKNLGSPPERNLQVTLVAETSRRSRLGKAEKRVEAWSSLRREQQLRFSLRSWEEVVVEEEKKDPVTAV